MEKFNPLIPELTVSNLKQSLRFYVQELGFTVAYDRPEDKFAFLEFGNAQLMLEEGDDSGAWATGKLERPYGRGINFQIATDDVNALANQITLAGYPLKRGVEESWYRDEKTLHGVREFLVQDPDGYLLRFQQNLGIKPVAD